jgi:CRP-like cAMP-binding protein
MPGPAIDLIRSIPFFSGLSEEDAAKLCEEFVERRYEPGELIVGEGQHGMSFFIAEEGTADVAVHGRPAGTIEAGSHFGELSLFQRDGRRSATVTAQTPMRCWSLPVFTFRPFVESRPQVAWALLETLAAEVRELRDPANA